ncbi:MAG: NAD(P)/FAD-dependent oxidoreductase [Rhizomicrobium sp.]
MDRTDVIVVGAGVIGLAVARALALAGREVVILERERRFGTGVSSRNSEVIHAGIYYPRGSLKAAFCRDGRSRLYSYCDSHKVPYDRCGKLIVAEAGSPAGALDALHALAAANGVEDIARLSAREATRLEPELVCGSALLSPSTGIIDSHAYMLSLLGDAQEHGAVIAYDSKIVRLVPETDGVTAQIAGSALKARVVINAAGLDATAVARTIDGLDSAAIPETFFAKGCYFTLSGRCPFRRLIYPLPDEAGLGVHLTLDLAGRAKFGPDVEWIDSIDYDVPPARASSFYAAVRRYWPGLPDGALVPGYAGIRPKIAGPGAAAADFRIADGRAHGAPGVINLFGIESPGLTASLAIADHVERLTRTIFDA